LLTSRTEAVLTENIAVQTSLGVAVVDKVLVTARRGMYNFVQTTSNRLIHRAEIVGIVLALLDVILAGHTPHRIAIHQGTFVCIVTILCVLIYRAETVGTALSYVATEIVLALYLVTIH
jgi:hypothetical protein